MWAEVAGDPCVRRQAVLELPRRATTSCEADQAGIAHVRTSGSCLNRRSGALCVQDGPGLVTNAHAHRTADGVNFTKAGAGEAWALCRTRPTPAAGQQYAARRVTGVRKNSRLRTTTSPGRPVVGPVLPLNATNAEKGGQLLGAARDPDERQADPLATRVLNQRRSHCFAHRAGAPTTSPWPRPDISGTADTEALPRRLPSMWSTRACDPPWLVGLKILAGFGVGQQDEGYRGVSSQRRPSRSPLRRCSGEV